MHSPGVLQGFGCFFFRGAGDSSALRASRHDTLVSLVAAVVGCRRSTITTTITPAAAATPPAAAATSLPASEDLELRGCGH